MKKIFLTLLATTFIFSNTFTAFASEQITVDRNKVQIYANGNKINSDNFLYKGTTYVPLRAVSENMGSTVNYIDSTKSVAVYSNEADYIERILCGFYVYNIERYSNMIISTFGAYQPTDNITNDNYLKMLETYDEIVTLCNTLNDSVKGTQNAQVLSAVNNLNSMVTYLDDYISNLTDYTSGKVDYKYIFSYTLDIQNKLNNLSLNISKQCGDLYSYYILNL